MWSRKRRRKKGGRGRETWRREKENEEEDKEEGEGKKNFQKDLQRETLSDEPLSLINLDHGCLPWTGRGSGLIINQRHQQEAKLK